ncbi:propanediol/glycerol family dehydratase large subunit [Vagococcus intermedius]|uniref:Propanediol/glycerol family dehydratase large subunit n=1 Tax=Vagococcus intermedius TaxID=2991418 RepID=A0AAF0CT76_9ENTE|nr:propanediol/glycerol family dehydratase large subunit [Vagococcus intermedius]WEG72518.1 propanediol/glycerol family dehydratase large subunit [Vagococcus intermedius]WEG74606.1 propanediol/glycerol family dehydratase large subunit [Vagococcus intermedius]
MKRSKRFEALEKRPIHEDGFVKEWIDEGFIAMESPNDPKPSIKIENGIITELDGKKREDFDLIDNYIASHGIDKDNAEKVLAMDSVLLARMLCDPNVSREEIIDLTTSMTPAKTVEVVSQMNVVEMMMAMQKMRPRRRPATQSHVTNLRDNPVQIAADAAEGALRGFAEQETTVAVARYAPLNAISIMVGSQVGRPGVLTQCSVEEALELDLGMRGFTAYAETISVYGTDPVFTDGDDTPWSKGFLASCYASRGLKMRFTSGSGSEVMMGYAEGKSMLYLEARCIFITKASGVQGLQNGGVSCIGIPGSVPSGIRGVLAENLICTMMDLEVASANDQAFSHSDMRRTERLMMQFLPGTDYISSGYSSVPNYDNMFAGSNTDAEDFDDYNVFQRDLKVDGGVYPVTEEETIKIRNKAARAIQAVFEGLGLPKITDEEVEAATYAHGSKDMPDRNLVEDMKAAQEILDRKLTGVDVVKALAEGGFQDVAQEVLNLLKQRIAGDFLQTSAMFDENWHVISAVNDCNDYMGPGTGYRVEGEQWERIKDIPMAMDPRSI